MCQGRFDGKFTNHSLRATSASRMYQSNVPEQVIKEVTGHRSDCVRIYKRTSDDIRENTSNKIGGDQKCEIVKNEEKVELKSVKSEEGSETEGDMKLNALRERDRESLSVCQMIKNVIKTRLEIRKRKNSNVNKVVAKLVKKGKKRIAKIGKSRKPKSGEQNRYIVDLNLNLKLTK